MATGIEFRFKIEPYTPDTLPMARLAEYMADLAKLFGEPGATHFVRLDYGSTDVVAKVDVDAAPKVAERVELTSQGMGPPDAMLAVRSINQRLRADHGTGELRRGDGAQVIVFPGRLIAPAVTFAAIWQDGTLDGIVTRLGGKGDFVNVELTAGAVVYTSIKAPRATALDLRHHMLDKYVRLRGKGKWLRDTDERWALVKFKMIDFDVLDSSPLLELVKELRAIPGSEWDQVTDPWAELRAIRGEDDEEAGKPN